MAKKIILTNKLRTEILDLIEDGRALRSLCSMLPISKPTYYRFIAEDADFATQVQRARDKGKILRKTEAVQCVQDCIRKGNGKLALEYLQCTWPAEYAKRRIQDTNDKTACPYDRLLDAIHKRDSKPETETK